MSDNFQTRTKFFTDKETETTVEYTIDNVPKFEVGTTVIVSDGSYNRDKYTKEKRYGISPLFKYNKAKVIETGCNEWSQFHLGIDTIINTRLDLLLEFPEGEKVYCSCRCVDSISEKDFSKMLNNVLVGAVSGTTESASNSKPAN